MINAEVVGRIKTFPSAKITFVFYGEESEILVIKLTSDILKSYNSFFFFLFFLTALNFERLRALSADFC